MKTFVNNVWNYEIVSCVKVVPLPVGTIYSLALEYPLNGMLVLSMFHFSFQRGR